MSTYVGLFDIVNKRLIALIDNLLSRPSCRIAICSSCMLVVRSRGHSSQSSKHNECKTIRRNLHVKMQYGVHIGWQFCQENIVAKILKEKCANHFNMTVCCKICKC